MMMLSLYFASGTAISIVSLIGFILGSGTTRYAWIIVHLFASIGVFLGAARALDRQALLALGCSVAVASVLTQQILAFWFFPGLAKDIEAFGRDHIERLAIMCLSAIAWYSILAIVTSVVGSRRT
jgi:hypothetical protein